MNTNANSEEKGIIGRVYENDLPVIYKFVNEMPTRDVKEKFTWLTVISWKYDGNKNNGMPLEAINKKMMNLEDAVDKKIEAKGLCKHAYSRTGNNLKELIYYIHDREEFMEAFNKALSNHPQYPIEISFYADSAWEDFQQLLDDFNK